MTAQGQGHELSTACGAGWRARYRRVRQQTRALCHGLEPEDCSVQSMPSASPVKWHLAHTTWFFERFVLAAHDPAYRVYDEAFEALFNSYYRSIGTPWPRPARGLITRPTLGAVLAYRAAVDERMDVLLGQTDDAGLLARVELGLNHEQQHQELLLTDIKHAFSGNPLRPAVPGFSGESPHASPSPATVFLDAPAGVREIGHDGAGFCFDNETPRHRVFVQAHALAGRLVTAGQWREFMAGGGYRTSTLWLADGWDWVQAQGIDRPLYWLEDGVREYTLAGVREIDPGAPVCHVSYYEADAFARWCGMRLPREAEWELAAETAHREGNFLESGAGHPRAADSLSSSGLQQLFGDVWEWTASPYSPYPGYHPPAGALGEYNGKFMCNQFVCRGGSCVTPGDHVRATYRNFFYPSDRWQFLGLRLARD